jgi:Cys-tRNA(Pro)/Cys-tRNA(Cys) deacylase
VDDAIEVFDTISISAGIRGMQILISPRDYLKATNGTLAALAQGKK